MTLDESAIKQSLRHHLNIEADQIEPVWEPCDWSKVFRIGDRQGKIFFLKGTPRNRPEALVTQILHEYDAVTIPAVLSTDLLPEHEWRWFLIPDAGTTDYDTLSLEATLQTAYSVGHLQRQVSHNRHLPQLLPQCLPWQYNQIIRDTGCWIKTSYPDAAPALNQIACSTLPARQQFFDDTAGVLSVLPATCVHGDLWSGNIAVGKDHICLLDWGDAVWGTGTTSIINLIFALENRFPAHELWNAYAQGCQQDINHDIIRASQIAYEVTSLIIERELARLPPVKSTVPAGILPILEELVRLSN